METSGEESEEGIAVFNFESEHETLKNNSEYQQLLKTLLKLQQQRIQAVERLEKINNLRENLITNPRQLVNSLENGDDLGIPPLIEIAELPDLEWSKYNIEDMITDIRPVTRKKNSSILNLKQTIQVKKEMEDKNEKPILVRGRVYDDAKPKTFNQQWTIEEQKLLEELLIKYPEERISTRRFAKIAKELGTRTLPQVQSRIQKYFIALKKNGLPVPGRKPSAFSVRSAGTKASRGSSKACFMNAFNADADCGDDIIGANNFDGITSTRVSSFLYDVSDEEDLKDDFKDTEDYRELIKLKKLKRIKENENELGHAIHLGFKCDRCGISPIEGPRWHCTECQDPSTIDFCSYCYRENLETMSHSSSHQLQQIKFSKWEEDLSALS